MESIEKEIVTAAPPSEVWAALTRAERVSEWFGAAVEIDARAGATATFTWDDGRRRVAFVQVVVPERLLVLRWLPVMKDRTGRSWPVPAGEIRVELQPCPDGTRVRVSETSVGIEMRATAR